MSLNTIPVCPGNIVGFNASVTTAQTDKSGATTTNLAALYTAVALSAKGAGALVVSVTFASPLTTVAGSITIFKKVNGVLTLLMEIAVGAVTSSASAVGFNSGKISLNEQLNPGDSLWFGTTITQAIHASGNAGEY